MLSLLSVVFFHSARWSSEDEAELATRESWERVGAIILLVFGAAIMSVSEGAPIGALVAIAGLLLMFLPFPLLGSVSFHGESPSFSGFSVTRIFPALCSFGIFLRLESQLRGPESIAVIALAMAALTWLCGLFQNNWRSCLTAYVSGAMPVAVALLLNGSAREATLFAIGALCGSYALAACGSAMDAGGTHSNSNRNRALWIKILAGASVVSTVGIIGSVSGSGLIPWIDQAQENPQILAGRVAVLFLGALLAWKVFWQQASSRASTEASWTRVLLPALPILASIAAIWTGDPAGGAISGTEALFTAPLPSSAAAHGENGLALVCGLLVLAMLISLWTDRKEDRWQHVSKSFPRFSRFVSSGYGADTVARALLTAFSAVGRISQSWLDERVWNRWLPQSSDWIVKRISNGADSAVTRITQALHAGPHKATDVSGKLLQLVHNGDVQGYLFWALACGAMVLLRFLNLTGAA